MSRFNIPVWVKQHHLEYKSLDEVPDSVWDRIRKGLQKYNTSTPEVSIVIPAYNEEKNLLGTLSSFAAMDTSFATELLVVNNKSTDRTQEILDRCGVRSIFEPRQGISFTRQTGLNNALGKYILNADGDSIYPPGWINAYTKALQINDISCVHGRHSFIPSPGNSRIALALHELMAETMFDIRNKNYHYLNVLGFNFAFRKADGVKVGGFNTSRQKWQDGWMALQLMELGKIELIRSADARVWTSDRRLMHDGGLAKAYWRRFIKHAGRLREMLTPRTSKA
jgi:glycosyltransferase involved in cell wall biosynthesis